MPNEFEGVSEEFAKKKLLEWFHDIHTFARDFFPHLLTSAVPDFHKQIYRELPRHPFLLVEAFRGAAKSTIGLIIYSMHFAIFRQIGDISLISKSESFILNEVNRKIKSEFETNERLRYVFGDFTTKKWSETYFVLRNGIAFEGGGIGGQLRGGRRGLIMLDDLEDEESVLSEEQRDKLRRRIGKELIPKLLPGGQMIYFGTPVHMLCYLRQIANTPNNGWYKMRFPAYKGGKQEKGNEMWPAMFPHERLQEIKTVQGTHYFSAEYMCNPISEESLPIKEEHIVTWTKLPRSFSCVIAIDPAYSEDNQADFKVAVVVGIDGENNRYLLDCVRTHDPQGAFFDEVWRLSQRWREHLTSIGAPNGGGDKEFYRSLSEFMLTRSISAPLVELKNTFTTATGEVKRKKKARVTAALQPHFERLKYYIHPDHIEARDEILSIGQSRWDDIVDAMAYAEQILQPVFYDNRLDVSLPDRKRVRYGATGYGDNY